jgi:hypothetical protein
VAEQLDLTSPVVIPQRSTAAWAVLEIHLVRRPPAVSVLIESNLGERIEVRTSSEAEGLALLSQLNTANLTIKSLQKRALEWCATKLGALTGTVSGTPD